MKRYKALGILLMIWVIIFSRTMTGHFGNNWFPESYEESMCDITSLILFILGNVMYWKNFKAIIW